MHAQPVTLTLDRGIVHLEPLRPRHAADLLTAGADDAVWKYLAEWPRSLHDMQGFIERAIEADRAGRELPFAVIEASSGKAIGSTRYEEILPKHRSLEIGWTWYGVPWQRTACNTECKLMLLQHAFETLGAVRVQLKADTRNERSLRAIERIGAIYEGTLRSNRILPDGYVRDSAYYSVIAREWPAVKDRLQRLIEPRP